MIKKESFEEIFYSKRAISENKNDYGRLFALKFCYILSKDYLSKQIDSSSVTTSDGAKKLIINQLSEYFQNIDSHNQKDIKSEISELEKKLISSTNLSSFGKRLLEEDPIEIYEAVNRGIEKYVDKIKKDHMIPFKDKLKIVYNSIDSELRNIIY